MPVHARSDLVYTIIPAENGGCGEPHRRPVSQGAPAALWTLNCPPCEDVLRHDPHWSPTVTEIPETYDEVKAREDFDKRGAKDKDAILTLALARLAGISAAELPGSLTRMISGVPAHVPGTVECPSGHIQAPGQKFCGECGAVMHGAPRERALPASAKPDEPPAALPANGKPPRLRDARADELKAMCRNRGLSQDGTRAGMIARLSGAGVTSADYARFVSAAA
jgi:hypothetical protein